MRVLTVEEARSLDRRALEELGLPGLVLMESAALGATLELLRRIPDEASVLVLAGGGHNGGDGLAVARQLHLRGRTVRVELWASEDRLAEDTSVQLRAVRGLGIPVEVLPIGQPVAALGEGTVVIDALLGTGASAPLRAELAHRLDAVRRCVIAEDRVVVALDGPTGLDLATGEADPATLPASVTLTFAARKPGHGCGDGPSLCGEVRVVPIGVPLTWPGSRDA